MKKAGERMLDKIKDIVDEIIYNSKINITVESVVMYGENKLEYALSIEDCMASISILSDFTYDFFALEIESEDVKISKTMNFNNINDLFKTIDEDLRSFIELGK